MTTTYQLTSHRTPGRIELQYTDGCLTAVKIEFKTPLSEDKYCAFFKTIAWHEDQVYALEALGFSISRQLAANQKLQLFCGFYMQYYGIKYKVSAADSGKIKLVDIDEQLLTAYFNSQNFLFKGKHSVSNLVRYYNELRAEMAKPAAPISKHPDYFSQAYQNKLSDSECSDYWRHLHSLGLRPQKDRFGKIKEWIKQ